MDWLLIVSLAVTGWVGCAEFASVALVHPIIRTLDTRSALVMEQGLLRTFGRVMPVAMTLATVLGIVLAVDRTTPLTLAAAGCLVVALVVTIVGNVPINRWTGRIPEGEPPAEFVRVRRRWEAFQAVRGGLQLVAFLLVCVAAGM